MAFLEKIEISGFRSIRRAELEMRPINVLIGANGAGKSNLVSFFQMLNASVWGESGLQDFVIRQGGASRLLHYGAKRTHNVSAHLQFHITDGIINYEFNLTHPGEDILTYTNETVTSPPGNLNPGRQSEDSLKYKGESGSFQKNATSASEKIGWSGHRQSFLSRPYPPEAKTQRVLQRFLNDCRVYHFNETTPESPLRQRSAMDESTYLRANGGNLPAYLLYLRDNFTDSYRRIVQTLQQLLPWFEGFYLEAEKDSVVLRCHAAGHADYPLTVGQISDGSLRLMALVTLLRQPAERRPQLIILDEPELGLHPAAESTIARLIQGVAVENGQVLVATQSANFLNNFTAEDVVVVANENGESQFIRHTQAELAGWLKRYSLGEVWLKNLIGGRP